LIAKLPVKPTTIIRSDLERTQKTTKIIVDEAYSGDNPTIIVEPLLNERNWGDLAGKPKKDYPKGCKERKIPPNGESMEAFYARSNKALIAQLQKHTNDVPPLVVAHKGTIEAIVNHFGLDFPDEPKNAILYEVEITPNPRKSAEWKCTVSEYAMENGAIQKAPARLVPFYHTPIRE
jgi:broad specificity phosphatase PhoE